MDLEHYRRRRYRNSGGRAYHHRRDARHHLGSEHGGIPGHHEAALEARAVDLLGDGRCQRDVQRRNVVVHGFGSGCYWLHFPAGFSDHRLGWRVCDRFCDQQQYAVRRSAGCHRSADWCLPDSDGGIEYVRWRDG